MIILTFLGWFLHMMNECILGAVNKYIYLYDGLASGMKI